MPRAAAAIVVLLLAGPALAAAGEPPRRTLQGSTEQAADAPGWNGRLPEAADPRTMTGAGSRVGLDTRFGDAGGYGPGPGMAYGYPGHFHGIDNGACGRNRGPTLPGSSQTAGSISGGTFRSTLRCADGYPGLPPQLRGNPGWRYDVAPPYRGYDDPAWSR